MAVGHGLAVGELYAIARQLVWRYRHVAEADLEEAVQDAVAAMVGALRQATEAPSDPRAYVRRVAYLTVQLSVWSQRSPATIHSRGDLPQLAARSESVPAEVALADTVSSVEAPDVELEARQWAHRVRRLVRETVGNDAPADREVARLVLLEDYRPAEASQELQRPLSEVYVVTQRIKQRLLKDARTRELWRDMPSREMEARDGR